MTPIIRRTTASPNRATFTIPPIRDLILRYVGDGKGWIDPYAGDNSPAEFRNDMLLDRKAEYHLDALDFVLLMNEQITAYAGVLYDPPYSRRQVSEHYKAAGRKVTSLDTSDQYYNRVKNPLCDRIVSGGYAISFGYHTNGFGVARGFTPIEYLVVAHGSYHYDTLVTVEQKAVQP